mgnify:CR=1 FL=1
MQPLVKTQAATDGGESRLKARLDQAKRELEKRLTTTSLSLFCSLLVGKRDHAMGILFFESESFLSLQNTSSLASQKIPNSRRKNQQLLELLAELKQHLVEKARESATLKIETQRFVM